MSGKEHKGSGASLDLLALWHLLQSQHLRNLLIQFQGRYNQSVCTVGSVDNKSFAVNLESSMKLLILQIKTVGVCIGNYMLLSVIWV